MSLKHASDTTEWSKVLEEAKGKNANVIVDCWATWCGPCKAIAPVFEALSKEYSSLFFVKVDVDKAEGLAGELGISAMPTFQVWSCESGSWKKVDELVGADKAKLADLAKKYSKQ
eukprot:jgi/Astpho2/2538/Aster-04251